MYCTWQMIWDGISAIMFCYIIRLSYYKYIYLTGTVSISVRSYTSVGTNSNFNICFHTTARKVHTTN